MDAKERRKVPAFTRILALMCVRQSRLETLQQGLSPVTHAGDYSDVVVVDAEGRRIPDRNQHVPGQWVWDNSLSARYLCTELLPMAASQLSPRTEMVYRRHAPPAHVPELRNSAFDLMTRSPFIAQVPAEPKQSTTQRNARRIGKSVRPMRSAVTPKTTTTPASGPGYKLGRARAPRLAVARHVNGWVSGGAPTFSNSLKPRHDSTPCGEPSGIPAAIFGPLPNITASRPWFTAAHRSTSGRRCCHTMSPPRPDSRAPGRRRGTPMPVDHHG